MDYSPDGSLLAVAGFHEILIHKADGSELVGRLVGLSERIESVAFSPDGSMVAATGGLPGRMGEVQVWNVAKKTLKVSVPVTYDTVYGVAWSPDSKLVSFGCSDNTLRAIQVSNGKQVLFMGGHNDWVLDSVFSRDGKQVISVGRDMTAKHTEVETERLIDNLTSITPGELKGGIAAVAGHPLKDEVLVGGSDGQPQVFRLKRQTARKIGDNANVVRKFPRMPGRIWDLSFSRDGKRAAGVSSLNGGGTITIYNAEYDSGIPGPIKNIFNKTPNAGEKQKLEEYWAREVKVLHSVDVPETEMFSLAFSPDGKILAASGADGKVRFIEVENGRVKGDFVPVMVEGAKVLAQRGKGEQKPLNRKRGKRAELGERRISADEIASLSLEPGEIVFNEANQYVQLLVTAILKQGGTVDVTRQVSAVVGGDLLEVSARGRVQPVKDGEGTLSVTLGNQKASVKVTVNNVKQPRLPDYVRDVKPVLSRMGCDAGTCHGAKDGKNGFKLSLRGYDPLVDVRSFSDDISARRVNYASPDDSLMLLKATGAVPHEGQQVTEPNSEYYRIIRDWISNGTVLTDPKPVVKSIEVFPNNPVIQEVGGQQQIRVVATYKDGSDTRILCGRSQSGRGGS
jgi:WD40 repeat protein